MNTWTKRLFILLSIGGGYAGAVIISGMLPKSPLLSATQLIGWAMIATFCYGVFGGLSLLDNEVKGLRRLRWFFLIQIPVLSSPFFAYSCNAGLSLGVWWIGGANGLLWRFGSEMTLLFRASQPWGIGVNLVGLAMFVWTIRILARMESMAASPVPNGMPAAELVRPEGTLTTRESPVVPPSSGVP